MSLTPAEAGQLSQYSGLLPIGPTTNPLATTPFAQTYDRRLVSNITFQPASGTIHMTGIWLAAQQVVTGITFVSGTTGETGGTHLWYALYKSSTNQAIGSTAYALMAQSTDDAGATSFGANTALRKALTAAQTCPYTGLYLLGFMCANSLGTQPALYNIASAGVNTNGNITGMTPIVASTADAGLAASAAATLGSQTTIVNSLYAFVD